MRIQARILMPDVTGTEAIGYWPAFWTLGSNYRGNYQNWPSVGEFDIMENVNGINSVWGVFHCGVNPGGPCRETDGIAGQYTFNFPFLTNSTLDKDLVTIVLT